MGDRKLDTVLNESDLGVVISNDLKVDSQCNKVVKNCNRILGMINRTFSNKTEKIMLSLYKALVRSHTDYCAQVGRPYLVKDVTAIKKIQRRFTRTVASMRSLSYEDRLNRLKLTALQTRHLRGDLILLFKIVKGFVNIDKDALFAGTVKSQ